MFSKRNYKIKSLFVGIIVGVAVQYIVEVVVKLFSKTSLKDSVRVTSNWQSYYGAGIAGGINGLLLTIIPSQVYSFAAVLVVVAVNNALLVFSSEEEIEDKLVGNLEFTIGIVRDVFLIVFIVYIINLISNLFGKKSKESNDAINREEKDFNSLLEVTIVSSIILSVSFAFTQNGVNKLLGIGDSLNDAIVIE